MTSWPENESHPKQQPEKLPTQAHAQGAAEPLARDDAPAARCEPENSGVDENPAGGRPGPGTGLAPGENANESGISEPQPDPLPIAEAPRFEQFEPSPPPPARIPNFGHLCLLLLLLVFGLFCAGLLAGLAIHHHLLGVATKEQAVANVHYELGTEALLYFFTLLACLVIFPLVWGKGFFAGVQWNAGTALRLRWRLISAAGACFALAFLDSVLFPGPANAPIDMMFRQPGAAWLLFAFGITFAPFFEETFFRGFLLPSLCTAYDWFRERIQHVSRNPLAGNGHPQWTVGAMVTGSILTSLPFAALHAQQTGYSWGPFVLLVFVSLVLCAVRLGTRSLAASVLVHASYNFMLFFIMLVGTHGFRHFEKM